MDKLVQTLGITGLSKSQVSQMAAELDAHVEQFRTRSLAEAGPFTFVAADALVIKVREGGRVVPVHALVATDVNADGHREILGLHVTSSEDGAGWLAFFRDLVARGLSGVKLVTSDAHNGLTSAIAATLPGATWQHCRTHYAANLMAITPKSSWGWVKALLHSVYDQPDADAVHAQFGRVLDALAGKLPTVADHLEAARADICAFTRFPKEIWRQIWSNYPMSGSTARSVAVLNRGGSTAFCVVVSYAENGGRRSGAVYLVGWSYREEEYVWACSSGLGADHAAGVAHGPSSVTARATRNDRKK